MAAPVALAFRIAVSLTEMRANLAEMRAQLETTKSAMQTMAKSWNIKPQIKQAALKLVDIDKVNALIWFAEIWNGPESGR